MKLNIAIIIIWIAVGILSSLNSSYNVSAIITIWLVILGLTVSEIRIIMLIRRLEHE